jgi:hypothetical protein
VLAPRPEFQPHASTRVRGRGKPRPYTCARPAVYGATRFAATNAACVTGMRSARNRSQASA